MCGFGIVLRHLNFNNRIISIVSVFGHPVDRVSQKELMLFIQIGRGHIAGITQSPCVQPTRHDYYCAKEDFNDSRTIRMI